METVAALLILSGGLLIRQTSVGRARDTAGDIRDYVNAALTGNFTEFKAIASRPPSSGSTGAATGAGGSATPTPGAGTGTGKNAGLLENMRSLGSAASDYQWGHTGPDTYDCSGLVWRAVQASGVKVGRFTTTTFTSTMKGHVEQVPAGSAAPGDIVLWAGHHIGVVSGKDLYYSALNEEKGILETKISTMGLGSPTYWRLT